MNYEKQLKKLNYQYDNLMLKFENCCNKNENCIYILDILFEEYLYILLGNTLDIDNNILNTSVVPNNNIINYFDNLVSNIGGTYEIITVSDLNYNVIITGSTVELQCTTIIDFFTGNSTCRTWTKICN